MFFPLLMILMFFSLLLQHFVGALPGLGGHILLFPMVFFYAAAALPLEGMLFFALIAGLMWDCLNAGIIDGQSEMIFGWSILLYGALGGVMNGLRPLYLKGFWQLHCALAALLTSVLVLLEYVVLTFRREPFEFLWPRTVWMQVAGSGLATLLISPLLFFILNWVGRRLGAFQKPGLLTPT